VTLQKSKDLHHEKFEAEVEGHALTVEERLRFEERDHTSASDVVA